MAGVIIDVSVETVTLVTLPRAVVVARGAVGSTASACARVCMVDAGIIAFPRVTFARSVYNATVTVVVTTSAFSIYSESVQCIASVTHWTSSSHVTPETVVRKRCKTNVQ
ncbi:hypothetical protein NP493_53g00001 [Ridgeia piscesae]|uniref:Uncharacterized protein n=1 Tax=Ridgeia piscesae TaxID=27915 RepID=A0AAD9PAX4_RIDPI|nr:hypothetical protein NP493_53g00001 [Ridgeia piscesae]